MAKARKPAAKPKAKERARKPKPEKAPKPTVAQLSDQDRQRLLFKHKNKIKPLIAELKDAQDELRAAYEVAKNDGIPKKQIELAIELETSEGVEKLRLATGMVKDTARWMNVADQLDLFGAGEKLSRIERLFEDGRIAGLNGTAASPPDHLGQKDAQTWLQGHAAGRIAGNEATIAAGGGFKSLGQAALPLTSKIPPATDAYPPAPLGTEPPTHVVRQ